MKKKNQMPLNKLESPTRYNRDIYGKGSKLVNEWLQLLIISKLVTQQLIYAYNFLSVIKPSVEKLQTMRLRN